MLAWIVGGALAAYVALCVLLYAQQRRLIYYPQATRADPATTDWTLARPDAVLRGWVVHPGRRDAVLYFGGNAEPVQANREDFAATLPGRSVYLPAYRGYGASEGTPSEAALLADALAAYDDVRARHPGGEVAVIGRSLGSGVATHVAVERPVSRLVLVTPFDSLAYVAQGHYPWAPVRWLLRDRYASAQRLPRYQGELLVLRAGRDAVVPPARTDALLQRYTGRARVVDFPSAGHDDLSADPRYWRAIGDFLGTGAQPAPR